MLIRKIACLYFFIFAALFSAVGHAQHKPLNVALFVLSPVEEQGSYWWDVVTFARASADDLGITLQVFYNPSGSRKGYVKAIETLLKGPNKPDALLASSYRTEALNIIKLAEQYQVPLIMFNNQLPKKLLSAIGTPRSKYKYFIGQVKPDDYSQSYLLAEYLIEQAAQLYPEQAINIVGISGGPAAPESIARNQGLITATAAHYRANLLQIIFSDWSGESAYRKANLLMKRHQNLQIIWCASDLMALHSLKAINELDKAIITGGIDWTTAAITSIKNGKLTASSGGHFITAGYALVLLFDYFHGHDFADIGPVVFQTQGGLIHQGNVDKYFKLLTTKDWSGVEFTQYSRVLTPSNKNYDFSFERLMAQALILNVQQGSD